jgi:hypothetical protein
VCNRHWCRHSDWAAMSRARWVCWEKRSRGEALPGVCWLWTVACQAAGRGAAIDKGRWSWGQACRLRCSPAVFTHYMKWLARGDYFIASLPSTPPLEAAQQQWRVCSCSLTWHSWSCCHQVELSSVPPPLVLVQVELMEVVDFFRKPEKFRASGARPPKGVLLVGPPGAW